MNKFSFLIITGLLSISVFADETAVCVGVQGTQIVELDDPYMTVARVNIRQSIRNALKKRSAFVYKSNAIRVKNQVWTYTRVPDSATLKNHSFGDIYVCTTSEN
jgi:hypothetical protein